MKDWDDDNDNDEWGDEFDYFDDHPEDDPFQPKPTCTECGGLGMLTDSNGREYTCPWCGGSGAIK